VSPAPNWAVVPGQRRTGVNSEYWSWTENGVKPNFPTWGPGSNGERNFLGEVALTCGLVLAGRVEGGAPPGQGLVIEVCWLNPG
jgi:hypothetical protein